MHLNEYPSLAIRTAKIYPTQDWNLIHAYLGIASEVGELQENISAAWLQMPFDPLGICEEGGDISWYVAYLCDTMGWNFGELFLQPDKLSDNELMAVAVLNKNPPAMTLVLGAIAGDIGTLVKGHLIYGKPLDADNLKLKTSHLISLTALIMDIHGISYTESCLPENIDKLKKRYPVQFTDVDAMERKDKTPSLVTL